MISLRIFVLAVVLSGLSSPALAWLKICNSTSYTQSVAIGYKGSDGWMSEGWWNIQPDECMTPVGGDLRQRYYYYRAEVNGGDFDGENYMFCTTPREFTIHGDSNCGARGYDRESFREIDTGATAVNFTLTLVP